MNKYLISGLIAVALIGATLVYLGREQKEVVLEPVGATPGGLFTTRVNFDGGYTLGSGATGNYSSTTATSYTAAYGDLRDNSLLTISTSSANSALTFNLPQATSTWSALLPKIGQSTSWWLVNGTGSTTLVTTIALESGNQIDLQEPDDASDFNLVLVGTGYAKIECFRKTQSTEGIVCAVMETTIAD